MELTRFQPYRFTTIAEAFDLHLAQLLRYLHRMSFTEAEYRSQSIPPSAYRPFLLKTAFNWSIILAMLLLAALPRLLPPLQVFKRLLAEALDIDNVDLFCYVYIFTFLIIEDASLYSVALQAKYRNTKLDLIYHYRSTLDWQFSEKIQKELVCYYIRYSYLAIVCNKAVVLFLAAFALQMVVTSVRLTFLERQMTAFEFVIGLWLTLGTQLLFFEMLFDLFTLLTGMFFIIKIFRVHFDGALQHLHSFCASNRSATFLTFYRKLMKLHRHLTMYNRTIKEYILDLDVGARYLTSFILVYTFKQRERNVLQFTLTGLYLVVYLYDLNAHLKLSYFQTKTHEVYLQLTGMVGRDSRKTKGQHLNVLNASSYHDLRYRLKVDYCVDFLQRNQMGFTSGNGRLFNKGKVVESVLYNLYMLVLLAKKVSI